MESKSKKAVRERWLESGRCLQCGVSMASLVETQNYGFKTCPRCRENMRSAGARYRNKRNNALQALKEGNTEAAAAFSSQDYVAQLPTSHHLVRSADTAIGNVRWARLKAFLIHELQNERGRSCYAKRVLCQMAAIERGMDPRRVVKLTTVKRELPTKKKGEAAA